MMTWPGSLPAVSVKRRVIVTLQIAFLLSFCSPRAVLAGDYEHGEDFCSFEAGVDLSNATANATGFLAGSGAFFPREATRLRDGVRYGCVCDIGQCLLVCPPRDVAMIGTTRVAEDFVDHRAIPPVYTTNLTIDHDEEAPSPEERFRIVVWNPCPKKLWFYLDPQNYETDEFYLLRNGSLFLPRMDPTLRFHKFDEYCLDLLGNDSIYIPRACALEEDQKDDYETWKFIGLLVAVPFLVATVIVYSILPELRNIRGNTLRCYLCCLIVTYVGLGIQQLPEPDYDAGPFCVFLGFTVYFAFLASFFWLNAMCFDMWRRFGGLGSRRSGDARDDGKIFVWYSIYAWGIPVVLTAICIAMEFAPGAEESVFHPGFRLAVCWFHTKTAEGLYLYGLIGITIACNICLFICTSMKLLRYRRSSRFNVTGGESRREHDDRYWFGLYWKLFVVMGITWSTEIISWLWEKPRYFWYIMDLVNALQGILIFVIFVCTKKIWRSLKKLFQKIVRMNCCARLSRNSLPQSPETRHIDERITNPFSDSRNSSIFGDSKTYTELAQTTAQE